MKKLAFLTLAAAALISAPGAAQRAPRSITPAPAMARMSNRAMSATTTSRVIGVIGTGMITANITAALTVLGTDARLTTQSRMAPANRTAAFSLIKKCGEI